MLILFIVCKLVKILICPNELTVFQKFGNGKK